MKIILNGEIQEIEQGLSVADLISFLGLKGKRIAVEVNEEIVPAGLHLETMLTENDSIEVVNAIGGG